MHAVLDGLRPRFMEPSSPDQAAFHEGFADVVALLSIFRLEGVVDVALGGLQSDEPRLIDQQDLSADKLRSSALLGLAEQMGDEMGAVRGRPLRQSAQLTPSKRYLQLAEFQAPHRRGEILVAAMMNAFLEVWIRRVQPLFAAGARYADRSRVVEEGAAAAAHLLTMAVRALDYTPPVDLQFGDFLSAALTADMEAFPDDSRYGYREALRRTFGSYGIEPSSLGSGLAGAWKPPPTTKLTYARSHFAAMQRDPEEVFRFVWENRVPLGLDSAAYTYVDSVRTCTRLDVDGYTLREAVGEYVQILDLKASELRQVGVRKPDGMPSSTQVRLYGGGALVFDEYGQLKFHVTSSVRSERQTPRLEHLWQSGFFGSGRGAERGFSRLHRRRAVNTVADTSREAW